MSDKDIALIAHLMRRAGFGATYAELEERAARGYEATVEDLLHPERFERADEDLYLRYETVWDGNFRTASIPRTAGSSTSSTAIRRCPSGRWRMAPASPETP